MNLVEYYIIEKKENLENIKIILNEEQVDSSEKFKNIGNFEINLKQ